MVYAHCRTVSRETRTPHSLREKYDALSKRISSLPQHRKKLTAIMKFFLASESLCLAVRELTASATIMSQNLASGPHDKPSIFHVSYGAWTRARLAQSYSL